MAATAIRIVMLSLALAIAGASAPAFAETLRLKADLLPVAGTGSKASGNVIADYDTASRKFTWSGSYKDVATYATSASFHGAPDGPRRAFVRIKAIDSPFEGSAILSDKQGEGLLAGEWSIVVRTAGFPKGELRGQLTRGN
jgi:CHRD domain-containing protein